MGFAMSQKGRNGTHSYLSHCWPWRADPAHHASVESSHLQMWNRRRWTCNPCRRSSQSHHPEPWYEEPVLFLSFCCLCLFVAFVFVFLLSLSYCWQMTLFCSAAEIETLEFLLDVYWAQAFMTPLSSHQVLCDDSQCLEKGKYKAGRTTMMAARGK